MNAARLAIEAGHPDAGHPLLAALARALARHDGAVVVRAGAGNLVRPRTAADAGAGDGVRWLVEVEGLPNLLHEFVHFVFKPTLLEDHGFDYALIPFDTARPEQRAWLWEELACCVVSCAYLADRPALVAPWFAEQVGIQHHFYGFTEPEAFFAHVDALAARHPDELHAALDTAYARTAGELAAAGYPCPDPPRRPGFGELWSAFRAGA